MAKHHAIFAPSSLPMLEQCPCFERAEDTASSVYRDRGTVLHEVFEDTLRGKEITEKLTPFEKEQIEWAVNHVRLTMSSEFPLEIEQELVLLDDEFNIITFGTGDVLNGPQLFDLKTGDYHNYWLQVACYALMQMDRIEADRAHVDLLFTRHKNVHRIDVSREEAARRIRKVVDSVLNPDKKPRANPYCRWCRKVMTCEAVVHLVSGLELERYEITDPSELSAALMTSYTVMEWAERVQAYAKEQALAGMEIPFFFLKSRAGAREIMDVKRAFELAGLPSALFLSICNLPVGKLEDAIGANDGINKTAAKKVVNERLSEVIRRRPPTVHLAPTKNEDEPTER